MQSDKTFLKIGTKSFQSRLLTGTGKYNNFEAMNESLKRSKCEIITVAVRRIHDHGKSGWFILVPFYNLYLVIADGEGMPNAYGPVPTNQLH